MALRVGRLGWKLMFQPKAVVTHVGAPRAVGQRFDWRTAYSGHRNHVILLISNFGFGDRLLRRYLLGHVAAELRGGARRLLAGLIRPAVGMSGMAVGVVSGLWNRVREGADPRRRGEEAEALRGWLACSRVSPSASSEPMTGSERQMVASESC
jgi:GT2 family glycosyltransferase